MTIRLNCCEKRVVAPAATKRRASTRATLVCVCVCVCAIVSSPVRCAHVRRSSSPARGLLSNIAAAAAAIVAATRSKCTDLIMLLRGWLARSRQDTSLSLSVSLPFKQVAHTSATRARSFATHTQSTVQQQAIALGACAMPILHPHSVHGLRRRPLKRLHRHN